MTSATPPVLSIRNLVQDADGVRAIDGLSAEVGEGEVLAVLAEDGAPALLRVLGGFEAPDGGEIAIDGQDARRLPPHRRPVNTVFQSYALFPHLSVRDNIAFGLRRDGLPGAEVSERVEKLLALARLGGYAKDKPHQLTPGQRLRAALVRALARRPRVLLLESPLSGLAPQARVQAQVDLARLVEQAGVAAVLVTSDPAEALCLGTRVAVLRKGRVVQAGTPADVYEVPGSRYVAELLGAVNLFDGQVKVDARDYVIIETPEGTHYVSHGITATDRMEVTVAVRPEKVVLQATVPVMSQRSRVEEQGHNTVRGEIAAVSYQGNETHYQLKLASGMLLHITRKNTARLADARLERGQEVYAWWDGSDVMVLTR